MDVDTRLLRYFIAVAEEGNLTRAAEQFLADHKDRPFALIERDIERKMG